MFNPWLTLTLNMWRLGIEAQGVIALRLMRLASGGAVARREAARMVSEKGLAAAQAGLIAGAVAATGGTPAAIGRKVVGGYRKRVRANRRRLRR